MRGFFGFCGVPGSFADGVAAARRRRRRGWALGFAATVGRSALPASSLRCGGVVAVESWDLRRPLWDFWGSCEQWVLCCNLKLCGLPYLYGRAGKTTACAQPALL